MSAAVEVGEKGKAGIENLALSGATVVVRNSPTLLEKDRGNLPLIVLVVGEEGDSEPLTARERVEKYPLAVVIYRGDGKKTVDDPTLRAWREAIKRKLDDLDLATFAGLSAGYRINRCVAGGKAPFDPATLKLDASASLQVFTVEVIETRATS